MNQRPSANTGFIAYLIENAESIAAAGDTQRPNPPATAALLILSGGCAAVPWLPDRLWPLFAVLGLVAIALAAKARRIAEPGEPAARIGFWALTTGAYAGLVAIRAFGLE